VARSHQADVVSCVREGAELDPKVAGMLSMTVDADKHGAISDVMCSLPKSNPQAESAMCGCLRVAIGRWRLPAAHGRLGLLDAAPFILEYRIAPAP